MDYDGTDLVELVAASSESSWPDWQPVVPGENQPPTADAGPDQFVECTSPEGGLATLDGTASSDPDSDTETSDIVLFEWFEDYGLPTETFLGTGEMLDVQLSIAVHTITLQVTDSVGQTDRDEVVVEVGDTTPPEISVSLKPEWLWPPNHKMKHVHATVVATDVCSDVSVILESVVSNEADNGQGDGNTKSDIKDADIGTEDYDFRLRAERSGKGDGRIYTATYTATDDFGNAASESDDVIVPHDMRRMWRDLFTSDHGTDPDGDPDTDPDSDPDSDEGSNGRKLGLKKRVLRILGMQF
jgi:hypothetical protein